MGEAAIPGREFHPDPYAEYARLRADDPIHRDPETGVWVITRYGDVAASLHNRALRSDRFGNIGALAGDAWAEAVPTLELLSHMMLYAVPEVHTRVRGLVSRNFPGAALSVVRPLFEKICAELLARPCGAEFDLIEDYARPLSIKAIEALFGMSEGDREPFRLWWYECMAALKAAAAGFPPDPTMIDRLNARTMDLRSYIARVLGSDSGVSDRGVIAALAGAAADGDRMTEDELLANCILLLSVGQDSVRHAIGTAIVALEFHPEQRRKLRDNPGLMGSAVEEFLRYESSVQSVGRRAEEETVAGSTRIARGDHVLLMLGSANRDPAQFEYPDQLNVERSPNRHLAFAYGPHICLGAAVARLELQASLGALLRHSPEVRPDCSGMVWEPHRVSRGLARLPMRRVA